MTKLEELKAARDAALYAYDAAYDADDDAENAYQAELKKQKENSND